MTESPDPCADLGDLLDFEPVVRRHRVDGWSVENQRAFIAALAMTGSPRRAAKAIGKNPYNAGQLRLAEGAEGFSAAWDKALKIAQQRQSDRLRDQMSELARRSAPPEAASLRGREEGADNQDSSAADPDADADHEALAQSLFGQYLMKVQQERQARLAGRVVEADFTLRQLTMLEVAIDLAQEHRGVDTWTWLAGLRRDGRNLLDIARTPFSRFLDEARRMAWEGKLDEPERPEPTPEEYFFDRNGYSLEQEFIQGGPDVSYQKKVAELEERHRRAAAEQVEWEARATERSGAIAQQLGGSA